MAKFSEETLNGWRKPPSDSEETKLTNAENRIRQAIAKSDDLKAFEISVFGQGSYANDTNVRLESDVDINVCCTSTFFAQYNKGGVTDQTFGYVSSSQTYDDFKEKVRKALVAEFGSANVRVKNKCFSISENTTRVKADVVPTFELRRFDDAIEGHVIKGVKYYSGKGEEVINYPLQHIANGKQKNTATQKRYKRVVRIFKKVRYKMIDDGIQVSSHITSFLLECMVWNVPDSVFNLNDNWTKRVKDAIIYIYGQTKNEDDCREWGEVSELLYLFRGSRKWTVKDVNEYMVQMWNYMGFNE